MPRKKPFSNKQRKVQIQKKRERKREKLGTTLGAAPNGSSSPESGDESQDPQIDRVHHQPVLDRVGVYNPNRYRLHFERESKEEIERRKLVAKRDVIRPLDESSLEVSVEDVYCPGSVLDIPKRPSWHYGMSKAEVEGQEEAMFEHYLKAIYEHHKADHLSYFEHNLETWRQLWRVLEISDVVLLITDIRHPALHFSPALYTHVVRDLKKELILILNKVDLVPPEVVVAWRHYFLSQFHELKVICFTCHPNRGTQSNSSKVRLKGRRGVAGRLPSAMGPRQLLSLISRMYQGKVDTSGWSDNLATSSDTLSPTEPSNQMPASTEPSKQMPPSTEPSNQTPPSTEPSIQMLPSTELSNQTPLCTEPSTQTSPSSSENESEERALGMVAVSSNPLERDSVRAGVLTIGMVGHPNVGKSSIINGLLGRKVVSTSRTPGHTKHFQTIFLTPSLRLCDCPGLVFPSLVNRQLQVLSGIYPIAQVREPYTAVGYVAQRLPLVDLLALKHPLTVATVFKKTKGKRTGDFELDEFCGANVGKPPSVVSHRWTAWDVCDAWAEKRGYYTARGARLDTYRAANSLLRLVVDGRICLYFVPPGYTRDKGRWDGHPDVIEMRALQQEGLTAQPTQGAIEQDYHTDNVSVLHSTQTANNKFTTLLHVNDV